MAELVRLKNLIPEYYDDIYDMQMLLRVEQYELDGLHTAFLRSQKNMFVLTADEDGISVFEQIFGLDGTNLTLDTRRYNVLTQMLPPQPITFLYLNNLIQHLNINARLESIDEYHVNLLIDGMSLEDGARLDLLLKRMLPANLTYTRIVTRVENTNNTTFVGSAHATGIEVGGN